MKTYRQATQRPNRSGARAIALLGIVTLLLAACGDGDPDGPDVDDEDASAEEPDDEDASAEEPDDEDADPEETIELSFSSIFGPSAGLQMQMDWLMDEVEVRTDGQVEFERFYAASLLGAADTLPGLDEGRVDTGYLVPAYAPANLPLWNVTFVPVEGANSESIARAQSWMVENNEAIANEFEQAGVRPLVFNMIGDLGTIAGPEPITSVSQLEGAQVRSLGYFAQAMELRGMSPVVVEAQETYESIDRGVIDGAGGFAIDVLTSEGLQEVAPWMVFLDLGGWVGAGMMISLDTWESLPTDVQDVLTEVAEDHYENSIGLISSVEEEACDQLLEAGGGVTLLPDDEVQAWRDDLGDSLWESWREDATSSGASEEDIASVEEDWRSANAMFAEDSEYTNGLLVCAERTDLPG